MYSCLYVLCLDANPSLRRMCVYLVCTVELGSLWVFTQSAFIGTTISLPSFKEEFGLENDNAAKLATVSANIVSIYQAGSFFGAFAGYPVGYFLGRKWGLVLVGAVFCIGALIQCLASHKTGLGIMYAGRVVVGFCIGIASNLAVSHVSLGFRKSLADITTVFQPIYISEVSPAAIRGRLIGLYELGWQIGAVIGFFINYVCSPSFLCSHFFQVTSSHLLGNQLTYTQE